MAKQERDKELRKERDRELYSLYLIGLREQTFANQKEAADWVRTRPATKFYVSSKTLVNFIGEMMRGKNTNAMRSRNQEKMMTLYGMYVDFVSRNPDCKLSRDRICEILVDEPAPSFFICTDSCVKAIERERQRHIRMQQHRR